MIDKDWVRNLAESEHNGQNWVFHNPDTIQNLFERRKSHILSDLRADAQSMVQTYNLFDQKGLVLRTLESRNGINIMFATAQIGLSLVQSEIHSQLVVQKAFQIKKYNLHKYSPYFDTFGTLLWAEGKQQNLSYNLILQQALVELTESYYRMHSR
ncbi:hypothetical protein N9D31_04040 [Oligoflexaceae bacterium]|nr:hypothetical protein [Oligoflexaceae bacterium]